MGLRSVGVPWGSVCMDPIRNPFRGHSDPAGKMPSLGAECQLLRTVHTRFPKDSSTRTSVLKSTT